MTAIGSPTTTLQASNWFLNRLFKLGDAVIKIPQTMEREVSEINLHYLKKFYIIDMN